MTINVDVETGEWKFGKVAVIVPKDHLETPDNFFYSILHFLNWTSNTCQYTTEPIVVEFDKPLQDNQYTKMVSLQDFHSEPYFTNEFHIEFIYANYSNLGNYFPCTIQIKRQLEDVNLQIFELQCINMYQKYFLGIDRISDECYFKLFDVYTSKLVFVINKIHCGKTTITYNFSYNSLVLDELTILVILKKIMIY